MSDEDEWNFASDDDAKLMIVAAARFLIDKVPHRDRGDVMAEIVEIVCHAAAGCSIDRSSRCDDETPGIALRDSRVP